VWLGVMIGLNIQTSFLTPPFGFALFYLRGRCAIECGNYIDLQGRGSVHPAAAAGTGHCRLHAEPGELSADRLSLLGEQAPPPINPRLQTCIEEYCSAWARHVCGAGTHRASSSAKA
jgi:hypothetical protein